MTARVHKRFNDVRTLHAAATASLPAPTTAPTEGDPDDIRSWRTGAYAPRDASIAIDPSDVVTLPGPVYVCGYDADAAAWRWCGVLNNGADIAMTADLGFEAKVYDVGTFHHLRLYAAGAFVGAGTITVTATPFEDLR